MTTEYLGDRPPDAGSRSPPDIAGLPPLFIQVSGAEMLVDNSLRLAEKATHAEVEVTLEVGRAIIAVIGATGAQGRGLARVILADPEGPFTVRAITRSSGSEWARWLVETGAEVVEADLADEASLRKAFDGAYGAFVVTNIWESLSAKVELAQATAAATAAKDAGMRHVIWSTLEDTRQHLPVGSDRYPTLDGYTVSHFDAKGEADALFEQLGVPTTFLRTTFNWENFANGFEPTRGEDGRIVLTVPMGERRLAGMAVEDVGRTALMIFTRARTTSAARSASPART